MTVKPLFQKIEIGFWDFIILQMNRSAFLRFAIPRVYRLYHTGELRHNAKLLLVLAALGLATGFVLGVLSQV